MGSHAGTHVDPPSHFYPDGKTVDLLPLDPFIGPAWVVHLPNIARVGRRDLERAAIPPGTRRLLVRTDNSDRPDDVFDPGFAALAPSAGRWLVEHRVRLVGIDGPSIEPFDEVDDGLHRILLGSEVIIVEGLDLHAAPPGACELVCLPLRLAGADGAPARAAILLDG
jgi:arylformamidase